MEVPDYSSAGDPHSKREAISEGEQVAGEERRRLGLGDAPIRNVMDLLEMQGVRIIVLPFHDSAISGIFLYERELGPCILVNRVGPRSGLSFNAAHEYAHLLFDRRLRARVSTIAKAMEPGNGREDLLDVRADSFAAAFLLPTAGIERYVGERGRSRQSRQRLGALDIVYLQHTFGVSYHAALYRLQNLGWLDRERREELSAFPLELRARWLGVFDEASLGSHKTIPHGSSRYVYLALEAYREGKISLGKLAELLGMGIEEVRDLVWDLQVEPETASADEAVV
jgi:Zn-dependent peptidase ImmA (M78 family)